MSTATEFSRRSFLASSAAAAGGLALGFHVPFATKAAAQTATPEINAWVVIKPDDTVVVRIARVEMGQGTLTGLAQLVAEELECDWAKVTTEYPTPGQNVARSRIWGNFQTAGSQGIRQSHEYVRKGGAAARMMLVQAAANEWKVEPSSCTVAKGVITHTASGRSTTFGKVAEAAGKLEAPKDVPLKDPKTWTIAGKPLKRLDTPEKVNGKLIYSIDAHHARHAERGAEELPGVRRQDQELRRREGREDAGRQEGRAGRRHRRRRDRRHLVARQDRARCLADRMGQRPERAASRTPTLPPHRRKA